MTGKILIVGRKTEPGVDAIGVKSRTLPYESVGPSPDDGGPCLYCACAELRMAQAIRSALELARRL